MEDGKRVHDEINKSFQTLSEEAKKLILSILEIEKGKLHLGNPHGVYDEILDALDEIVQ